MAKVLVLGGRTGLGLSLAVGGEFRGHETTITRSSLRHVETPLTGEQIRCDLLDEDHHVPDGTGATYPKAWDAFIDKAAECDILFWVAGTWLRRPFHVLSIPSVEEMVAVHLTAPLHLLRLALGQRIAEKRGPFHLVVISSSSSWKVRADGQAIYGMVQAAKAQFARDLCAELQTSLPGTMVTLACPGGMDTEFFAGEVDASGFMKTDRVAECIWDAMSLPHEDGLLEMHLEGSGNNVNVTYGPRAPGR